MSQQRILDYHLARLKDRKPAARQDALQQLALLKPADFLDILQTTYAEDTDASVRESARKLLLAHHAEGLKSDQVAVRHEALRQYLVLDGNEAVHVAQAVYTSDQDEDIRETARKFLVEYYLGRLKQTDAARRSEAIEWLEQLNAEEALDALQQVFNEDVDGEVRKKAQQAGRTIFMNRRSKRA